MMILWVAFAIFFVSNLACSSAQEHIHRRELVDRSLIAGEADTVGFEKDGDTCNDPNYEC
jgi:hypothetical protein